KHGATQDARPRPESLHQWSRTEFFFETFCLEVGVERVKDLRQVAIHDRVEPMQRKADPVIADAILAEVIRADFLAAIAASNHGSPLVGERLLLLFHFAFVKSGTENAQGFSVVLDLRLLVLTRNNEARRNMCQANRRIRCIYRLPAGSG